MLARPFNLAPRSFKTGFLLASALTLMLASCASKDDPVCKMSQSERIQIGWGGNPALLGPAIVSNLYWEAVCEYERQKEYEYKYEEPQKTYFSCAFLGMSTASPSDETVEEELFSVSPPQSGKWCTYAYKTEARYTTHPFLGQSFTERPSKSVIANATAMFASAAGVPSSYSDELTSLTGFAEKWIDNGFGAMIETSLVEKRIDNGIRAKVEKDFLTVDMTPQERLTVVSKSITPDSRTDAECVRYEYLMSEQDNPIIKDKTLFLHDIGIICRSPFSNDKLVIATMSERYVQNEQVDPRLFSKLRTEAAEPFFSSLEFSDPSKS